MDDTFDEELERRLLLLESPGGGGMVIPDLARLDIALATIGVVVITALMIWWAY